MNLSAAQKLSLREWRTRVMAESAQALQRRAGLLQRLNCQMVGDDARSMERVTMVRASTVSNHSPTNGLRRRRCLCIAVQQTQVRSDGSHAVRRRPFGLKQP